MFDRFYPIFDSPQWLERMLPLGIKLVQLRCKMPRGEALRKAITTAQVLCDAYDCILVVNDHWREAIDSGCSFVHLGQEDLDLADISALRRSGIKLGISTHDDDELERALSLMPDYVALGPVYPTILKKMKWHQQGLERVTEWKRRVGNLPLVSIGGMSVERAAGVFEAGADIVSVVTDITLNDAPEARLQQWLDVTR